MLHLLGVLFSALVFSTAVWSAGPDAATAKLIQELGLEQSPHPLDARHDGPVNAHSRDNLHDSHRAAPSRRS